MNATPLSPAEYWANQASPSQPIGLGCMGMSNFMERRDDEQSIRVIHRSIDLGIDFLDTADMYGIGSNEELVGRAIRDRRNKVILATKFGNVRKPTEAS